VTKTVDGVCADCWGVKDPAGADRRLPGPRTRKSFSHADFDWLDPVNVLWAVGTAVIVLLVTLLTVAR
jgi:hypothetical protein